MNYIHFVISSTTQQTSDYVKNYHLDHSERKAGVLFTIDCSAFRDGEEFLEHMIGVAKGFKNNPHETIGYFEQANNGSILLNNAEALPEETLLRLKNYINQGKIVKFGSNFVKKIDVQFHIGLKDSCEIFKNIFPNHYIINLNKGKNE